MAKTATKPQAAAASADTANAGDREALEKAVATIDDEALPNLPDPTPMVFAEQVLIVSAPDGPRRRANLEFGPVPRELRWDELGPDPEAVLEALRRDPMIKIDGRMEERPATPEDR